MKESKSKQELVAYTLSFISFILPKIYGLREIILFGSVARGDFDKNSDIDLFFDIENKENEETIKKLAGKELEKFYKSKIAEMWFLKGVKNPISINVGRIEEWKLKRSIISEGISLYSRYKEIPENMAGFAFFSINPIKNITKRNRVLREIFGRNEKNYFKKGIIDEIQGKKLSALSFVIPKEHTERVLKLLGKEKVNYRFFEFWTDNLNRKLFWEQKRIYSLMNLVDYGIFERQKRNNTREGVKQSW